jgi:Protein of unknown function (DUF402)
VLLRSVYRGRVRWTFPHRLVELTRNRLVTYLAPGSAGKITARGPDGYLRRWMGATEPSDHRWYGGGLLWETRFGAAHALGHFWDEAGTFLGWYVNLQEPLRRSPLGWDTCDQALDICVEPDGSWRWKDEDELQEAIELGIYSRAEAEAIRAEGERVVVALDSLLPTGWEQWRPPGDWGPLELPKAWHVA